MIVNHVGKEIELIKQHEHARLSCMIAEHWQKEHFPSSDYREDILYAARHHDRAWIPLDQELLWNPQTNSPYDFTSYPFQEKLSAYTNGIDEVEAETAFGAILCSKHYSSFFQKKKDQPAMIDRFLEQENARQNRLRQQVGIHNENQLEQAFKLLQFCDDLSLYACMNAPGTAKADEVPWFREGFRQRFSFAPHGLMAEWMNEQDIRVTPFPFKQIFAYEIPFKKILKHEDTEMTLPKKDFIKKIQFVP
ncbi:DUF3891 family protein [Sediminibacillus massiliensis]|uniref:DUF3891 family protein n=1 Tax=Sediminibacillus massiliensis TaxID=1926277 RepID=UPI0009885140|nr:DUF3891 family protein [Sediminibacillus massiliensis]